MEEPPFEVEHFVPNVMTSFTVSLDKKFQVISFSKMVKSASKTHQNALNNVSDIGSAVTAAPLLGGIHNEDGLKKVATFMPPPDMHRSNRRFDDLISKLEKRYCSQGAYANESDEDDNGDSSDMRGRQDLSGSDMEVEGDDNAVPKKKKRAFQDAGDFDYDDPFIDDTDDLFLSTMMTKKTKTKHGGFFISSGVLEVTQKNKKGSLDGSGKSSAGSKTSTGGSKDKSKQQPKKKVVVVGSVINTSIPKPVISSVLPISPTKAASSSSSSSSAAKSFAKPKQAEASNSMASSGFGDSFDSSIVPDGSAKRVAKPKVEWQPKDIIINAMGTFETLVSDIKKDNSIKKFSPDGSDFTDSVDDCLIRLDDMVRACNSEVWSDSRAPSGYFERVSEILYNGESAPIRMKKIIKSIRSKNAARVLYVAMTDSIKALKLDIVANTSSYTPPPPKAATGADGAASPNKDNNQDASMLPGDAEDIADFDLGKSADATAAAKTPKAPVEYKFIVKWKPPMKTLAADIEEMLLNYIREENAYRACLSSSTKVVIHCPLIGILLILLSLLLHSLAWRQRTRIPWWRRLRFKKCLRTLASPSLPSARMATPPLFAGSSGRTIAKPFSY